MKTRSEFTGRISKRKDSNYESPEAETSEESLDGANQFLAPEKERGEITSTKWPNAGRRRRPDRLGNETQVARPISRGVAKYRAKTYRWIQNGSCEVLELKQSIPPSCLRQTFSRASAPPMEMQFDSPMRPAPKRQGDMDKVADVLSTSHGDKK